MMQSPLGNLHLQVQNKLAALPALKWVDADFGQLSFDAREYKPPVLFPCALINITGLSYEDEAGGTQRADGKLIVRIATAPFTSRIS